MSDDAKLLMVCVLAFIVVFGVAVYKSEDDKRREIAYKMRTEKQKIEQEAERLGISFRMLCLMRNSNKDCKKLERGKK